MHCLWNIKPVWVFAVTFAFKGAQEARPDLCRRFLKVSAGSTTIESMIQQHFLANTTSHSKRSSFAVDRYLSSPISASDREFLCSRPFVALTTVRNPWDRLISAFIGKVVVHPDKGSNAREIAAAYGIERACELQFQQVIRFVVRQRRPNIHFMPESERCGPERLPYDAVAHIEHGFESTLSEVSVRLGFGKPPFKKHISTTDDCAKSNFCESHYLNMLNRSSAAERRRKFYTSELSHLVAMRFATDIETWNYTF